MKKLVAYLLLQVFILVNCTAVFAQQPPVASSVEAPPQQSDVFDAGSATYTGEEKTDTSNDIFQGHAEYTNKLEEKNKELFTGEIDQLVPKDVIKMTVSQVLSTGYTEEVDEFFAEITSDVE